MTRAKSPMPGPLGCGVNRAALYPTEAVADTNDVSHLLRQLRNAGRAADLNNVVVSMLGRESFCAGVIAGIGLDILSSAAGLLKLVSMFVLAELHDRSSNRMIRPGDALAYIANTFWGDELRKAADERDAFLQELDQALEDLPALFEGMTDAIADGYKKDWKEYNTHMKSGSLSGRFKAGMLVGELLVDVAGLITGVVGAGMAGAKLASKAPRLLELAKSAKLQPRSPNVPRRKKTRGSGINSADTSTKPTDTPQSAPVLKNESNDKTKSRVPPRDPARLDQSIAKYSRPAEERTAKRLASARLKTGTRRGTGMSRHQSMTLSR